MPEIISSKIIDDNSPAEIDPVESAARIDDFLQHEAPVVGRLMGVHNLNIRVGDGWATNLETGEVTIDPRFFLEQGYSIDMTTYACLHEVSAHLREVLTEPELTSKVKKFVQRGEPEGIFHNILSDIAGNNRTHAVLPRMAQVAESLYSEKLFKASDYTDTPRHLQFLYKIIRQEMIPDSETTVNPEVDEMLNEFRNFYDTGQDMLKYSTQVAKSPTEMMSGEEKFKIWTEVIYPRWQDLLEQDRQDPKFQQSPSDGESGQDQSGEPGDQPTEQQPAGGTPDFSQYYEQYKNEHHSEPMTEAEHEAIEKAAADKAAEAKKQQRQEARQKRQEANPSFHHDAQMRQETGHGLAEKKRYDNEINTWQDAINELRDVYRSLLDEHVGARRRLRGGHAEGAILTPDRLAQTVVDIANGVSEPKAFSDYERRISQRELTGRSDYVFIFDRSGSMRGEKSEAAASSAVICMEALAGMQRDIETIQNDIGAEIDVDVRTAIYTFDNEINNPKPLSHGLSLKERLDTYSEVRNPGGANADSHALQMICELPPEQDRSRILVVVSDGEADNPSLARTKIEQLRREGWKVYGISIGSDAAVQLYAPHSQRVDDPSLLPDLMKQLIQETL